MALLAVVLLTAGPAKADCTDSIRIDSATYRVGPPWCGHRLDSADIADPAGLVRLPDSLAFEDYRIYVTPETRKAFIAMAAAARKDSVLLRADSGFRSPWFQRKLISRRLSEGKSFVSIIKNVAPPGYSEHHTGRALDLVPSDPSFARSRTYTWLKKHAADFGFTESYPKDFADGLHWEPWHWLYMGR